MKNSFIYDICQSHAKHMKDNMSLFFDADHYMTVKYTVEDVHDYHIKLTRLLEKRLLTFINVNHSILNLTSKCGYLEYVTKRKNLLNITTAELMSKYTVYKRIKEGFGINNHLIVNDFNLKIYQCQSVYNWIFLNEYAPLYADGTTSINSTLSKLKSYGNKVIVFETDDRWSKAQWKHMLKLSERRIKVIDSWDIFIIDLGKN